MAKLYECENSENSEINEKPPVPIITSSSRLVLKRVKL